jgi:hypothetical protein
MYPIANSKIPIDECPSAEGSERTIGNNVAGDTAGASDRQINNVIYIGACRCGANRQYDKREKLLTHN